MKALRLAYLILTGLLFFPIIVLISIISLIYMIINDYRFGYSMHGAFKDWCGLLEAGVRMNADFVKKRMIVKF